MTERSVEDLWALAQELTRQEALFIFNEAIRQNLFRPSLANWEDADLFRYTMRLAIFDALRVESFADFRELWVPLIGQGDEADALDWLVPIYLAAVTSPAFEPEVRRELAYTALI